jgi:hypothetical protein
MVNRTEPSPSVSSLTRELHQNCQYKEVNSIEPFPLVRVPWSMYCEVFNGLN